MMMRVALEIKIKSQNEFSPLIQGWGFPQTAGEEPGVVWSGGVVVTRSPFVDGQILIPAC